ncbi:S1C family serine protease, partial [bacterium]|nr:S1C family serine protease [bacterium]
MVHACFVIALADSAISQTATISKSTKEAVNSEVEIDILQLEEAAVKAAVRKVAASVVQIETIGGSADDAGVSTGTVVSADGLVLTAAYNLRHEPSSIFIKAMSSASKEPERFIVELLATDHSRNLCLLKADLPADVELVPVVAAEQGSLQVGLTTIAMGKVHDAAAASISVGILSATDRIWGRAVQTDAKISRTNYGGPLVNFSGDTIGVLVPLSPDDSSVESGAEWYDSGIGFAVPLEDYYKTIDRMAEGTDLSQGLLGITLTAKDIYADVPEIEFCSPKSPAVECGLLPGDTILAVDGVPVISQTQMKHVLGPKYAGEEVTLTVRRSDKEESFTATLVDRIDPFIELAIGVVPVRGGKKESAEIAHILLGTPATETPLADGDIISAVNNEEVKNWDDFQSK